ncbi:aminodeoxychorismate synthase component I [[Haemophilus] ducreyi]|uniref:aminodeoxychorismate synthase component I n=1 Tax=Haemophilus ducreyi TaxID=730 RepID=UPI0006555877|nr:aminodeoxychorismate synthase component I [[Haemophilus] ducreyi]AKO46082.1 aminobenzoate synthetase [[Haemophilus] ducreyi]AKO47423.1 aminobenzoate synthetase [[Haemophilus] ducreyi]AKO48806.1 aminobenzoate synthetase [[Haemophilus] ducreyi]AKO50172.1 aminobenzoate synthetase [[Haemophilus] ducreyi]ANF62620.1 aminodeoxychorismate synthase component I [[Haemophilus] ducreyi]
MQQFIQTANDFGQQKHPFFFLIDFEQQKPIIVPLEQAQVSGLFFDFTGKTNYQAKPVTAACQFNYQAIPLARYQQGFEFVQQQIQVGNSYLLNLTYPMAIHTNYDLAQLYSTCSAKYKLWFKDQFVCFSPETFVRIYDNKIYAYPMKGTINADFPNAEQQLMVSEKEFTEHNTIVDLIRNDLALVAKNIQVTKYRYVEKINTYRGAIYQTSSEICGELSATWQAGVGTLLAKLLPAGSISGAPKQKTIAIIQQAELDKRGYYTGIFGYFDGNRLESAVAIRYIEQQEQQLIFRSGGGITAKSELTAEYQELLEKVYVPISTV